MRLSKKGRDFHSIDSRDEKTGMMMSYNGGICWINLIIIMSDHDFNGHTT